MFIFRQSLFNAPFAYLIVCGHAFLFWEYGGVGVVAITVFEAVIGLLGDERGGSTVVLGHTIALLLSALRSYSTKLP